MGAKDQGTKVLLPHWIPGWPALDAGEDVPQIIYGGQYFDYAYVNIMYRRLLEYQKERLEPLLHYALGPA